MARTKRETYPFITYVTHPAAVDMIELREITHSHGFVSRAFSDEKPVSIELSSAVQNTQST